jgi:hypothetical protein
LIQSVSNCDDQGRISLPRAAKLAYSSCWDISRANRYQLESLPGCFSRLLRLLCCFLRIIAFPWSKRSVSIRLWQEIIFWEMEPSPQYPLCITNFSNALSLEEFWRIANLISSPRKVIDHSGVNFMTASLDGLIPCHCPD